MSKAFLVALAMLAASPMAAQASVELAVILQPWACLWPMDLLARAFADGPTSSE